MVIRIQYQDMKYDYVDHFTLDKLIMSGEVRRFFRPSENTWVNADQAPLRGIGGQYLGPERRLVQPLAWRPLKVP